MSLRRLRLILLGTLLVALVIGSFVAEIAADRPIFFRISGLEREGAFDSPGGKYRVYFAVDRRNGGAFDEVFVARPWWALPKHVGRVPFGGRAFPRILQGPLNTSVLWSANARYVGLAEEGWFVTVYDLKLDSSRHVGLCRDIIVGANDDETGKMNPRITDQKRFHVEVQHLLDSDGGAVPQP